MSEFVPLPFPRRVPSPATAATALSRVRGEGGTEAYAPTRPWLHVVQGSPPLAFVVRGTQVYAIDSDMAARIANDNPEALAEFRALETAQGDLALDDVTPPASPSSLSLNLAQACNLGCHYCYADEGRFGGSARLMSESVALTAIDRLIESAEPGGRVTVGFIGGEPLLNRTVLHLAVKHARARARERDVMVGFSITTNGTLVREEDRSLFRESAFAISVSLDGDAAVHDRRRPGHDGGGSYARAVDALAPLLAEPGDAKLAARATVTRDEMVVADRVRALIGLGFREVGVSPARTGPRPELLLRDEDWSIYLTEMISAADDEMARLRKEGGAIRFGNLGIALKEIHRGACRPLPCGAGYGYVSVSAEGRYFTCHRTVDDERFLLGDVSVGTDLESRKRFLSAAVVDRQEPCNSCWARYLCGGGCHAEVAAGGRAGCDFVRGWLEHCLRIYNTVAVEMPELLGSGA
ncbi:radical SAM protein [Paraburkholderia sediminicola]|uniref:radical SAM protein n=1 Tax=Paraburkholderia sediminicola TaxID=458836 RepID=UPI0038B9F1E6